MKSNKLFSILFNLRSQFVESCFKPQWTCNTDRKFRVSKTFLPVWNPNCNSKLQTAPIAVCAMEKSVGEPEIYVQPPWQRQSSKMKQRHSCSDASVSRLCLFQSSIHWVMYFGKFSSGHIWAEITKPHFSCFKGICIALISLCGELLTSKHRHYFMWSQWKPWLP